MSNSKECLSVFIGAPEKMDNELIGTEVEFIDQDTSEKIIVFINYIDEVKPGFWTIMGRVGKTGTFVGNLNFLGKVGCYKIS